MTLVVNFKCLFTVVWEEDWGGMGWCILLSACDCCYYCDYTSATVTDTSVSAQHILLEIRRISCLVGVIFQGGSFVFSLTGAREEGSGRPLGEETERQ